MYVCLRETLQPYLRQIIMTLVTRMQQNKTNGYVHYFLYFLLYILAINAHGLISPKLSTDPVRVKLPLLASFGLLTATAHRLWSQVVSNFLVPQIAQLAVKDRKMAAVGLTRLLTQGMLSLKEPTVKS